MTTDQITSSVPESANQWFRQLLIAALVVKIVYLAEYVELPFLYGPLFDSVVYMLQADRVRSGQFGDASLLGMSPLYGYCIAALRVRQGSILPIMLQLVLGGVNLVLLRGIAKRLFGEPAGVFSALLYLLYGPLLCFESKLMSETLGLALLLAALACVTLPAFQRGNLPTALLAGVFLALAVLARASLLAVVPFLAVATLVMRLPSLEEAPSSDRASGVTGTASRSVSQKARLRRTGLLVVGVAVVLTAYGGWTKLHSGLFVPVILVSSTAERASQEKWNGDLSVFRAPGEKYVSAFSVVRQAEERLSQVGHENETNTAAQGFDLWGLLAQVPTKLWMTFRDRETSFDYGYYGERTEAPVLYLCIASFGTIASLALIGLAAWVQKRADARVLYPLLAVICGIVVTTVVFHPSTRYRLPMVVAMIPLGGFAWASALCECDVWRRRVLVGACALVSLGFGAYQAARPLQRPGIWELRAAEAFASAGDFAGARARAARALAVDPADAEVRERVAALRARIGAEGSCIGCARVR